MCQTEEAYKSIYQKITESGKAHEIKFLHLHIWIPSCCFDYVSHCS